MPEPGPAASGKRTLVIGAGGQLGTALTEEFAGRHGVLRAYHRDPPAGGVALDLADPVPALESLERLRPEWILIAGAFCNVDRCETEADRCRRVNAEGPRVVAEWAASHDARAVYYSTDHVFEGGPTAYGEEDPVSPLNTYARAKSDGETAVRAALPQGHLILRTSGLYGRDPARRNFVLRVVDHLRSGETLRVPSDQWGSPTATEDLARVTRFLLEQGRSGTFHAVGPDFLTRLQFARRICACFGLDEKGLISTPTSELGQPARRPLRVRLSAEKLAGLNPPPLRPVAEGLAALRERLEGEHPGDGRLRDGTDG